MVNTKLTIGELKKLLHEYQDDELVILSSDEEGNSFGIPTLEAGIGEDGEGKHLVLYPILHYDMDATLKDV